MRLEKISIPQQIAWTGIPQDNSARKARTGTALAMEGLKYSWFCLGKYNGLWMHFSSQQRMEPDSQDNGAPSHVSDEGSVGTRCPLCCEDGGFGSVEIWASNVGKQRITSIPQGKRKPEMAPFAA
ncbi:expressed unknown protein [Seminavis robusta]|uniref:Uncharacterized protein n=1 Tax=Seminavis robusta TaxID=568900 RepID=A0A9N8E9Z1_9STRA|nr:expressed unknown protein [Seminavis robusta]|eukprot:Sro710_g191150.1 n/a (125) ;mRNA; r:42497-42871